jgi:trans-aconitate methyltransferase
MLVGGVSLLAYVLRQRNDPSACPYGLRFSLALPRPFVTRSRLREILSSQPGERVLEVGPGSGYYSLHAARWLEPDGTLEVLDFQQDMLEHTMRRISRTSFRRKATHRRYPTRTAASTPLIWSPLSVRSQIRSVRCAS